MPTLPLSFLGKTTQQSCFVYRALRKNKKKKKRINNIYKKISSRLCPAAKWKSER